MKSKNSAAISEKTPPRLRVGLKDVSRDEFSEAVRAHLGKRRISITLDPDVLDWFKVQAGGRGYQTLINATLRDAMREHQIAETLRRVIREELHPV